MPWMDGPAALDVLLCRVVICPWSSHMAAAVQHLSVTWPIALDGACERRVSHQHHKLATTCVSNVNWSGDSIIQFYTTMNCMQCALTCLFDCLRWGRGGSTAATVF